MKQEDLLVEVRDRTLTRVGAIPADLLAMDAEDIHNNVGTWKLQLSAEHPLAAVLSTPGAGIIVTGPTDVIFSGPAVKTESAVTATDPLGTLTVEGVDDTVILSDMLAWPDPSNGNTASQNFAYDERTGVAETLMHQYVNANCGPAAPATRQRAGLIMGTDGKRGAVVSKAARFQQLGELCKELADPASLGFRIVQRGTNLVFETYAVKDRTKEARLGVVNNTLAGQRVSVSTPQKTRVIVGGDGDGSNRLFVGVDNADSIASETDWGRRIESFIDERSSTDTAELTQKGTEALADGGATVRAAQAVPMEDSALDFGRDWFLGDKVSVLVGNAEMTAVVTGMVLKVDSDGYRLGATLGDPTPLNPALADAKAAKDLESRVSALERTGEATPAGPREIPAGLLVQASKTDDYPEGASVIYLTAADATAGGWDFGGKYGFLATRRQANGDAYQTWSRVHAATTHREDWVRGGNRSSGWAPWRQLDYKQILTTADFTQATAPTAYPYEDSRLYVSAADATAGGWDFAPMGGFVWTSATSTGYTTQRWSRTHGATETHEEWVRGGSPTTNTWSPWRVVAYDARLNQATIKQAQLPSAYPEGYSTCAIASDYGLAGGWDFSGDGRYGVLKTFRPEGSSFAEQRWVRLSPASSEEWTRTGSDAGGWTRWRRLAHEDDRARGLIQVSPLPDSAYVASDAETLCYSVTLNAEAGRSYKVTVQAASVDTDGTGDTATLRYAKQSAQTTIRYAAGTAVTSASALALGGQMFTTVFDDDSNTSNGVAMTGIVTPPTTGTYRVGVFLRARRDSAAYGKVRFLSYSNSYVSIEDIGAAVAA
ncbi:siphovirus ReqiPepy6 Gp37-like family protein [Streptomyces sp. NBC_01335]|uniref:siphovirus ReqiPepy6 Gp37-like family protein n=1 Tax=Streptomyces sp. NBC_01335 TaxID=2903828 RepID=UPI002E10A54C|nr:siphovirus ReqiPepy6 Gp37-like family protein [Streptomyces sp. NBC_01335]